MTEKKSRGAYSNAWNAEHTTRVNLSLNYNTDADIIEYLSRQDSKQGKIKELIRADIAKGEKS